MQEKVETIAGADLALFARLHGLMLAKLFGVPAVGVGYASKLHNFGQLLDRSPVVDLRQVVAGASPLVAALESEVRTPSEFIRPVAESRRRAAEHLQLLNQMLSERRSRAA